MSQRETFSWWQDLIVFPAIKAVVWLLLIVVVAIAFDKYYEGQEASRLDDINKGTQATVCVLALPVSEVGRDPAAVDACLIENGLEP